MQNIANAKLVSQVHVFVRLRDDPGRVNQLLILFQTGARIQALDAEITTNKSADQRERTTFQ